MPEVSSIQSVDERALERLRKLDTAALSDAMDSIGVPCVLTGIRPGSRAPASPALPSR